MKRNRTPRRKRKKPSKPFQRPPNSNKDAQQGRYDKQSADELEREIIREASMGQANAALVHGLVSVFIKGKMEMRRKPK